MGKKSKVTRIPLELEKELLNIKKIKKIKRNSEGYRELVRYSQIGREICNKDLLNANALWFGIQLKKNKKRGKK